MNTALQQLIDELEEKKAEARDRIGKTRTVKESDELKGQVFAYDESIYRIRKFMKTTANGAAE